MPAMHRIARIVFGPADTVFIGVSYSSAPAPDVVRWFGESYFASNVGSQSPHGLR